jgi:DNA-binding Lrp family transcriptional regulator
MVTAIVLIGAETDKINELAEQLAEIEGVQEVYSLAGRYDLAAIVRVRENDELADLISNKARRLNGIRMSETLIAFRVYSKRQLEAGFELGLS